MFLSFPPSADTLIIIEKHRLVNGPHRPAAFFRTSARAGSAKLALIAQMAHTDDEKHALFAQMKQKQQHKTHIIRTNSAKQRNRKQAKSTWQKRNYSYKTPAAKSRMLSRQLRKHALFAQIAPADAAKLTLFAQNDGSKPRKNEIF